MQYKGGAEPESHRTHLECGRKQIVELLVGLIENCTRASSALARTRSGFRSNRHCTISLSKHSLFACRDADLPWTSCGCLTRSVPSLRTDDALVNHYCRAMAQVEVAVTATVPF